MRPNRGPETFKPNTNTNMSEDKKNVPTAWLAERSSHYRFLQKEEMHGDKSNSYRQMAWAFEFVLEEWWKPTPQSPLVKAMNELLEKDGLAPETVTLIKMAIEAQETGKMPALPITLQPMPGPCLAYREDVAVCDDVGEPKGQCFNCGFKEHEHATPTNLLSRQLQPRHE